MWYLFSLLIVDGPKEAPTRMSYDPVRTGLYNHSARVAIVHVLDTGHTDHVETMRARATHAELPGICQPN